MFKVFIMFRCHYVLSSLDSRLLRLSRAEVGKLQKFKYLGAASMGDVEEKGKKSLSLSPFWRTQAETYLSTRTKGLFSILCRSIQQERLNILSARLHLRVFIKLAFSFHCSLPTMQLCRGAPLYVAAILV